MYTERMTNGEDKKPKPGSMAVLTQLPPGMLNDLPIEDQKAISEIVGKPILLCGYDDSGKAELEFKDGQRVIHFIYVTSEFIRKAV
jgi:hypothetical protein